MFWIKNYLISFILFLSLFYFTFYLPMSFTTYNSWWYKSMCSYHYRCERFGADDINLKIDELTDYFLHKADSLDKWTKKEKFHLEEVRNILDRMFIIAAVSLIFLIINYKRTRNLKSFSKINLALVVCFFIIFPFFKTFWREIFHPIFFDNDLWKNTKLDVSYYIMPRTFFKITVGFIFTSWLLINLTTYLVLRRIFK